MARIAVVDGANVAYEEQSQEGKPKVKNLTAMRDLLQQNGYEPIIIVDATLAHEIDDPQQLEALFEKQVVRQAPANTDADYFILALARENEAMIVSNDLYNDYRNQFSDVLQRCVPFMIVNGQIELYGPKVGKS